MLNHKKIAIIGISGSGKSTLARYLSKNTHLPVVHLDTVLWKGNWKAVPKDIYLAEHRTAVEKSEWIIEGYIDREMAARLRHADLVIRLDYSGIRCFWRAVYRWWKHRKKSRPELPSAATDQFDVAIFLKVLVRAQRRHIEEAMGIGRPVQVINFYTPEGLDDFIKSEFQEAIAADWVSGHFLHADSSATDGHAAGVARLPG